MPIQAKGITTPGAADKLAPFNFERRDPRANDVHIEITYAGICHSDIHTACRGGSLSLPTNSTERQTD